MTGVSRPAMVAVLALTTACGGSSRPEAAKPLSADAAKTAELMRLNADLDSDPALAGEYRRLNAQYFDGRLPSIPVRWEPRLAEVGPLLRKTDPVASLTIIENSGHWVIYEQAAAALRRGQVARAKNRV